MACKICGSNSDSDAVPCRDCIANWKKQRSRNDDLDHKSGPKTKPSFLHKHSLILKHLLGVLTLLSLAIYSDYIHSSSNLDQTNLIALCILCSVPFAVLSLYRDNLQLFLPKGNHLPTVQRIINSIGIAFISSCLIFIVVYKLNVFLDNSETLVYQSQIKDKFLHHVSRRRPMQAWVTIDSWKNNGKCEKLRILRSEWDLIIPEKSRVTLLLHKGAFELPWIERYNLQQ